MKKCLIALALCVCLAPATVIAHASARLHEKDIMAVFRGYTNPEFPRIVRMVSSGMDNELPRRFRREIGSVPGNHRILGHCWSFGDAIPRRVFDAVEKKHPGKRDAFMKMWLEFSSELVDVCEDATGFDRRRAQSLVALIHDVHLLGDRTPDNKMVEYVLTTREICNNIVKHVGVIWHGDHEFAAEVADRLDAGERLGGASAERATLELEQMVALGLGERLELISPCKNRGFEECDRQEKQLHSSHVRILEESATSAEPHIFDIINNNSKDEKGKNDA